MHNIQIKYTNALSILVIFLVITSSCKKFVVVDPPSASPTSPNLYNSNGNAAAVLTGIYNRISASGNFTGGISGISIIAGLSADELTTYPTGNSMAEEAYANALISSDVPFWHKLYTTSIYPANAAIEGISASKSLNAKVKNQLLGEAKFIRAFSYFYLVNFFGNIPLITTTDYTTNQVAARSSKDSVISQIKRDLLDAQSLLSPSYLDASVMNVTDEKVRPTKWAATALLTRVYLYEGDWANAELQATDVIANGGYSLCISLNDVFLKNSTEAIWQLQPVIAGRNTEDGNTFILESEPNYENPITVSPFLLSSFQPGDMRRKNWIDSFYNGSQAYYFPFKYKVKTTNASPVEYLMVFRIAELYLIRAEAEAQQNKIPEARLDLNLIRNRAGLSNTTASDQTGLLSAVARERQTELFSEWGHRWLDLKRTGKLNSVMGTVTPQKGGAWDSNDQLYPIPVETIQFDNALTQNPGYN